MGVTHSFCYKLLVCIMCVFNASVSCISLPVVAIILYAQFFVLLLSCHNFIGHNIMFGKSLILYEIIVVFPYIQSIWLES